MRYPSRFLLLYAVFVMIAALFSGCAYAESSQIGSFDVVSSQDAAALGYTPLESYSTGWWTSDSVSDSYKDAFTSKDESVVLTIPYIYISSSDSYATESYLAKVSYDFSAINSSVYASGDSPLKFYPDYADPDTEGTALFLNADGEEMTAEMINTLMNASNKILGGYIVMTLSTDTGYFPVVTVQTASRDFAITPANTEVVLTPASSDRITFTASGSIGKVAWEIVSSEDWTPYDSSYIESTYKVKASLVSTDAHTAVLSLDVPASADSGQYGYFEITAIDQSNDVSVFAVVDFVVQNPLTLTLSRKIISLDLNETGIMSLDVSNASGEVSYNASYTWVTIEPAQDQTGNVNVIITPYYEFLQGYAWSLDITATDDRGRAGDSIGIATETVSVYIYGPLSLDVSSSAFTISSGDTPDVTFSAKNASGDLSFEVSESWATVSGSKFVVNSIDESLQGTTQTVTVTAKDDRGRAGNSRGEASVVLSVTVSKDFVPALTLEVSPASLTVNEGGSATATATASNALGEVTYTSDQTWAAVSGNTITVNYDSAYAEQTLTATITATDAGRSSDKTATANLSVTFGSYTPPVPDELGLTVSPSSITVNQGGSATATLSAANVLGSVSYSSSASWLTISGNTITVRYNSAYAGQTLNATITATDSGRTSNNTATATLSASFEDIIIPPDPEIYTLSLRSSTPSVRVNAGNTDNIPLTLTGAGSAGVEWDYDYDSVPTGASSSGNPLGLSFSSQSSTSAVLSVNPGSNAVPGDYTVHVYTSTTSGTSTGGDGTITITVNAAAVLSIQPVETSVLCVAGESFTIAFSAQNAQGSVSWDITNASWGAGNEPVFLSFSGTENSSATLTGITVTAGTYSFAVRASDGASSVSANVTLIITEHPNPTSDDPIINTSRANDAYTINAETVELTQEVIANLRASLGLTASDEIRSITAENILPAVSPDIQTETAMNKRGYQLAANLSRIRVSQSGLYAFAFSLPAEFVGLSMNDLAVFSTILESNGAVSAEFYASAVDEDRLSKGDLLGTDGRRLTNATRRILAVLDLEAGTTSGTFFGSVVIPKASALDELTITTAEITDEFKSNLAEQVDWDVNTLRSIKESNIYAPVEPSQEIKSYVRDIEGYDLAYKLNTIIVSEDGHYAFTINLPDEIVGLSSRDIKIYAADMTQFTSSEVKASDAVFAMLNAIEVDAMGIKLDTIGKKIIAIVLLQAGKPFSVYLAKLLIMLLLGGCEAGTASYAGYGVIALAGVVILLGARFLRRR